MLKFNEVFFLEHQKQMLKSLPSFSKALFCFYATLALVHPYFVPPPNQWIMSIISAVSSIAYLFISFYVKKKGKAISEQNILVIISLIVTLAMINTFLHLIITESLLQTTNIVFICVALSAVGFSTRNFFYIIIFINSVWLSVIWFFNLYVDPTFIHFLFTMTIGSFISSLMAITRYKLLRFSVVEIMRRKNVETKLKLANNQLNENANIDILTGLHNRRSYDSFLKENWHKMKRLKQPISLIIADIDHFKKFNDQYGHQVGDDVLVSVGKTLEKCTSASSDLIARYGGEEFVVITPNITKANILPIAEAMRQQVSELKVDKYRVTVSLGVATIYPNENSDLASLFLKADEALYHAKALGRNRVSQAK